MKLRPIVSAFLLALSATLLSGCSQLALLNPAGLIAGNEKNLLIDATLLMLIIVIPVLILVVIIAWKYRSKNTAAEYRPTWAHSTIIEAICWTVPCIIIGILATMTWITTHSLDPYKPIYIKGKKPIVIQAVALNWKWLFIYPKQGIATVNYIQIPVDTPVELQITADAPMNSLEIPRLAGQIYAMGGMRTRLHLVANKRGTYRGLSTNYSGDGFSEMRFLVHAGSDADFTHWLRSVRKTPHKLTYATYDKLTQNSIANKVAYYSAVPEHLFMNIIKKYMMPHGKTLFLEHEHKK